MSKTRNILIERSVCAVIITYHPTVSMMENLSKVFNQVQEIVAVDNGSDIEVLDRLRAARGLPAGLLPDASEPARLACLRGRAADTHSPASRARGAARVDLGAHDDRRRYLRQDRVPRFVSGAGGANSRR